MLLRFMSLLASLAAAAVATPVNIDSRAASRFSVTYLYAYQSTQTVTQDTGVFFEIIIQDLNAGPVNLCQFSYKPIPTPFPAFLTSHPCTNQTSTTNQNIDVHWTVRVDNYNDYNDFALSFKHDPGADSKGAPYDAAYDTSANGVLAPNIYVAQYKAKSSPVPLNCGEYAGEGCDTNAAFTLPATKQ